VYADSVLYMGRIVGLCIYQLAKNKKNGKISNILSSIVNLYINITILISIINRHGIIYQYKYMLFSAYSKRKTTLFTNIIQRTE